MIFIPTSLLSKLSGVGVAGHSGTGGYEALLEKLDDAELSKIVQQRRWGKTVKVKFEDLRA